jgi:hypothetical protein
MPGLSIIINRVLVDGSGLLTGSGPIAAKRSGGNPVIARSTEIRWHAHDAVARRPNAADVLQRSDNHDASFSPKTRKLQNNNLV